MCRFRLRRAPRWTREDFGSPRPTTFQKTEDQDLRSPGSEPKDYPLDSFLLSGRGSALDPAGVGTPAPANSFQPTSRLRPKPFIKELAARPEPWPHLLAFQSPAKKSLVPRCKGLKLRTLTQGPEL